VRRQQAVWRRQYHHGAEVLKLQTQLK
jgi:hypothetical protein